MIVLISQAPSNRPDIRIRLGAESASVRKRRRWLASRHTPCGICLEIRRFHPCCAKGANPRLVARVGHLERPLMINGRASALDFAEPSFRRVGGHDPLAVVVWNGNERSLGRGVSGKAATTQSDIRVDALHGTALDLCPASGGRKIAILRPCFTEVLPRFAHRLPASTAAQVCEQRLVDGCEVGPIGLLRVESIEPHDDSWGAESTLTATDGAERIGPPGAALRIEPIDRGDRSPVDATGRCYTCDPWLTVDQNGAAAALPLRAAAVLRCGDTELISQHVEQRQPGVLHLMGNPIDGERDCSRRRRR